MTKTNMDLSELLSKQNQGDFLRTIADAVPQLIMETDVEGLIGAGQEAGGPPSRCLTDRSYALADIILVDSFERKSTGRPWVTLAIDIAMRIVTGYHVSLEAPSCLSVALCLTRSVAPKAELLADLGRSAPWPAQRRPRSIHVDNGRDCRSHASQETCAEWGIDLDY